MRVVLPLVGVQETWAHLSTDRKRFFFQVPESGYHWMQLFAVSYHPPQRRPPSVTVCQALLLGNEGRVHEAPDDGIYNSAVL